MERFLVRLDGVEVNVHYYANYFRADGGTCSKRKKADTRYLRICPVAGCHSRPKKNSATMSTTSTWPS